jgi:hypothetical protein
VPGLNQNPLDGASLGREGCFDEGVKGHKSETPRNPIPKARASAPVHDAVVETSAIIKKITVKILMLIPSFI